MNNRNDNRGQNPKRKPPRKATVVKRKHDSLEEDFYTDDSKKRKIFIGISAAIIIILVVFFFSLRDIKKSENFEDIVDTTQSENKESIKKKEKVLKKEIDAKLVSEEAIEKYESEYLANNPEDTKESMSFNKFASFVADKEKLNDVETDLFALLYESDTYLKSSDNTNLRNMKMDAIKHYLDLNKLMSLKDKSEVTKYVNKLDASLLFNASSIIDNTTNIFSPVSDYISYTRGFTKSSQNDNLYVGYPYITEIDKDVSRITVHYMAVADVTTKELEKIALANPPKIDGIVARTYSVVYPDESYKKLKGVEECVYGNYVVPECTLPLVEYIEKRTTPDMSEDEELDLYWEALNTEANINTIFETSIARNELKPRKYSDVINFDFNKGKKLYRGVVYEAQYYMKSSDIPPELLKMHIGENVFDLAKLSGEIIPFDSGISINW